MFLRRLIEKLFEKIILLSRFIVPVDKFKKLQVCYYSYMGVEVIGSPEFIGLTARFDTSDRIVIHDGVVISEGVIILTHDYSIVNAQLVANGYSIGHPVVGSVIVNRNSFIGLNSILLPGTIIGANVIVAAGSVVSGVIDDGVIIAGVPARKIQSTAALADKFRFSCSGNKSICLPRQGARFVSLR